MGGRGSLLYKVNLVYKVSSRTARTIQRNPVSKKKKFIFHLRYPRPNGESDPRGQLGGGAGTLRSRSVVFGSQDKIKH